MPNIRCSQHLEICRDIYDRSRSVDAINTQFAEFGDRSRWLVLAKHLDEDRLGEFVEISNRKLPLDAKRIGAVEDGGDASLLVKWRQR